MSARVTCPNCRTAYSVAEGRRGKTLRCPRCKAVLSAEPANASRTPLLLAGLLALLVVVGAAAGGAYVCFLRERPLPADLSPPAAPSPEPPTVERLSSPLPTAPVRQPEPPPLPAPEEPKPRHDPPPPPPPSEALPPLPPAARPPPAMGTPRERLLAWVADNNVHPRKDRVLADVEKNYDAHVREGWGYSALVGGKILRSGKTTLVAGWHGEMFVFPLGEAEAAKSGVHASGLVFKGTPSGVASRADKPALALSDLTLQRGATTLAVGDRVAGRVAYKLTGPPPRGPLTLRLTYMANLKARNRSERVALRPAAAEGAWEFSFDPVAKDDRDARGATVFFADVVEASPGGAKAISSAAAAVLVVVP